MTKSFAEQVGEWARKSEARLERTWQVAVGDLATELSMPEPTGKVPHVTGNLANSLLGSTAGPIMQGGKDDRYTTGMDVGAFAATLKLSDTAWLGYRAVYARRQNSGFVGEDSLGRTYNQAGRHFVEHAIARWPYIVDGAAVKVKGSG